MTIKTNRPALRAASLRQLALSIRIHAELPDAAAWEIAGALIDGNLSALPGRAERSSAMNYQPQSVAESEMAFAMDVIYHATKILRAECRGLPETAISVALINLGIQSGLRSASISEVIDYLRDAADHIEKVNS